MARKFDPHKLEWLQMKIKIAGYFDLSNLPPKVEKDISKVQFDFENCEYAYGEGYNGCEILTGYHIAPNGLPFLGVVAGGDWEVPVFFIVYYDSKDLRGYIPTDGNTWNTDTKKAYGNDDSGYGLNKKNAVYDGANVKKRWPELFPDLGTEDETPDDEVDVVGWACPKCDPVKILKDIASRITPR